jgi:SAM-dependent methyltransferase
MGIKKTTREYLKRQSFHPDMLGVLFNPFYFIRRGLYENIKLLAPQLKGRLLDFGCGRKPYEELFRVDEYIGVDIEQTGHEHSNSKIDVYYDGRTVPFPDGSFDAVFCSEVLEHVFNVEEILTEINRILKDEGKILLTVPFCWNEHEVPYDFGRYSSFGIQHVLFEAGFDIIEYKKSGNFAKVNWQLWALYFNSLFHTKSRLFNYICSQIFIIPINILGLILLPIFPKNNSLFFNNVVLAKKRINLK